MKTFGLITGWISFLAAVIGLYLAWNELQTCKNRNSDLQIENGTVSTQNQTITSENIAIRMQRDCAFLK